MIGKSEQMREQRQRRRHLLVELENKMNITFPSTRFEKFDQLSTNKPKWARIYYCDCFSLELFALLSSTLCGGGTLSLLEMITGIERRRGFSRSRMRTQVIRED